MYAVLIKTAIVALAAIYGIAKVVKRFNSPEQAYRGPPAHSTDAEENILICEVCQIPLFGDAANWKVFEVCGHCFHNNCLKLFACHGCVTCDMKRQ